MNQIIDSNGHGYIFTVSNVAPASVTGTVGSNATLNIVCAGPSRNGQVVDSVGIAYNVKLPGSFRGLVTTFRRR